ncbi:MAG TPA: hypothetical protein VN408_42345, partial [Actinoplanes sp.]|nr:hypothetical protein [Actinoplanes sp.]
MQIQPRQQILDIWRATARVSLDDGKWTPRGRNGGNSISDAEQLLCLMSPATEIPLFRLDRPDAVDDDVVDALRVVGDNLQIPQRLLAALSSYVDRYSDADGTPVFSGGSYFSVHEGEEGEEIKPEQLDLDVVDSFSISVSLMLATIGFARTFRQSVTRQALLKQVDSLERAANVRLSAAMAGLLRSFTVNVFTED